MLAYDSTVKPLDPLTHTVYVGELQCMWRCALLSDDTAVKPRDPLIHTVGAGELSVPLEVCNVC